MDIFLLEEIMKKSKELEEKEALETVGVYRKEKKTGRLKELKLAKELFTEERGLNYV